MLFSLLVPGFGIARGDRFGLAVAWFFGLELGLGVVAAAFALESTPFVVGLAAGACWLIAVLVMLYQSYRPGRMTSKRWAAFAMVVALRVWLPPPAELVVFPIKMSTGSMRPTLEGGAGRGDHLIVDRLTYRFCSPRRGDVLVFVTSGMSGLPQDQIYVKRIVGMPGERLEIRDGSVFANGVRLTSADGLPPIKYVTADFMHSGPTGSSYTVAKDGYFVLGDNSTNSLDSRYWGCVPLENAYGKVTGIYYPFSRAGRPRYPDEPDGAMNRSLPVVH